MSTWRYLEDDAVAAAAGLAVDEALLASHGRDGARRSGGTLRLYTYRPHCALVGRYQSLEDEVDLGFCAERGFDVGRRPTGGGAIIMGPGQLGVAIAAAARPAETPRQGLKRYAAGVVAGLAALGVTARFRAKNDLEVDGRKIAGLGLYLDPSGAQLFHASVLVDLDVELMLRVLRIPGAKLSGKAIARVEDRVTTVRREVGGPVTAAAARRLFAPALAARLDCELAPAALDPAEKRRAAELVDRRYGNPDWTFQRSPRRNARGSAVIRSEHGLLRLYVALQGPALESVLITGDFNFPPAGLARLESALKWCRAEPARIREITRASLKEADGSGSAPALDPDALAAAVWEAARRARSLAAAGHPRRREGSCYFPDPAAAAAAAKETAR